MCTETFRTCLLQVTYKVEGFMDKNNDLLFRDLSQAMFQCTHHLLKILFPEGIMHCLHMHACTRTHTQTHMHRHLHIFTTNSLKIFSFGILTVTPHNKNELAINSKM